jgi:hypothetical protein
MVMPIERGQVLDIAQVAVDEQIDVAAILAKTQTQAEDGRSAGGGGQQQPHARIVDRQLLPGAGSQQRVAHLDKARRGLGVIDPPERFHLEG